MLRSLKSLFDYGLKATDGEIGSVNDFYFDDQLWTIRYLVLKTHKWLPGRDVLISPLSLGQPDWEHRIVPTMLNKVQIEQSPDIKSHTIVTREEEERLIKYYNWSPYWTNKPNTHLQSARQVLGYTIATRDDPFGSVDDLIIDDHDWHVRYFVVTTSLIPSKKVLLSLDWIKEIVHSGKKVHVDLLKKQVENSPEYNIDQPVNRGYEEVLYDYYGKPKYWDKI
ncbi:MAG: PRC-barrel domain-containing protein [Candidatus Bilamarchaeum sp.]